VRVNGVTAIGSNASFVRNSLAWDIAGVATLLQADFPVMEMPAFVFGRRELAGRHADLGRHRLSL
jgi:hypothetical protein